MGGKQVSYVLGIDGGGTKTTGVIASSKGEIFAEVTVGPTNPNSVGKEQLKRTFAQLFRELEQVNPTAFSQVIRVFAGLSGADHLDTRKEMTQLIEEVLKDDDI